MTDVLALHADLTEEQRIEGALAQKTASADLHAVYASLKADHAIATQLISAHLISPPLYGRYASLKADHAIATQLATRLGRSVPSLAAAECVIGT
jgi:hypothetical protein